MRRLVFFALFLIIFIESGSLAADTIKPRITVDVSSQKEASGSYLVNFTVKPQKGMNLTFEAPWKLSLDEAKGLDFQNPSTKKEKDSKILYVYAKTAMDEDVPGYQVKVKKVGGSDKPESISYTLEAFSCTSDKSKCFKDVVKEVYTLKP